MRPALLFNLIRLTFAAEECLAGEPDPPGIVCS